VSVSFPIHRGLWSVWFLSLSLSLSIFLPLLYTPRDAAADNARGALLSKVQLLLFFITVLSSVQRASTGGKRELMIIIIQ